MKQTQITLIQKESIAPAWWHLTMTAPDLADRLIPGQFLLVRCADLFSCYLRRPIFPSPMGNDCLSLRLRPDPDPGMAWLLSRQIGDVLDVIGPLGKGFPLPQEKRNILLISDGFRLDPLLGQMNHALSENLSVTLALGGSRAANLYPLNSLPSAVEFQAATLDGSLGHRGLVTDLLPDLLVWADVVYATGSTSLYHSLKIQTERVRFGLVKDFLYGLLSPPLHPCGVGSCLACSLETAAGLKLICLDGPVFDLSEIGNND